MIECPEDFVFDDDLSSLSTEDLQDCLFDKVFVEDSNVEPREVKIVSEHSQAGESEDHVVSEENSQLEVFESKKRPYIPWNHYQNQKPKVPRLMMRDIRKCYAMMTSNVLNTYSLPLLYGFLDTFFDRNVQFIRKRQSKNGIDACLQLNNINELAKFWYANMRMSPDVINVISDPSIQYTTGDIVCQYEKASTFIYDAPMDAGYFGSYFLLDKQYETENPIVSDKTGNDYVVGKKAQKVLSHEDILQDMQNIQLSVDKVVEKLPLKLNPKHATGKGTFVFSMDENKRITRVVVNLEITE